MNARTNRLVVKQLAQDVSPPLPVFRSPSPRWSPVSGDSTEPLICEANTVWLERQRISRSLRKRAVLVEDRVPRSEEERRLNEAIARELRWSAEDVETGQHREEFEVAMGTKRDAIDETKRHLERADESAKRTGDKELVRKVDDAHQHIKKHIDPIAPPKSDGH